MESLVGFPKLPATVLPRPSLFCSPKAKRFGGLLIRAKINGEEQEISTFFQTAINAASLRFQETQKPKPLLHDEYAGCFLNAEVPVMDMSEELPHYCIATRYIDDKLLQIATHIDGVKQIVLLNDGMDTRPYRLHWPYTTILFDISPERVFQRASEKLTDFGAKIPKTSVFFHIPWESTSIQWDLSAKGFNGELPSIWALQGYPLMSLASFEEILCSFSTLASNGCTLVGELPLWLVEAETDNKGDIKKWMEKIFGNYGLRVDIVDPADLARNLRKPLRPEKYEKILFTSEQLRFSDDQMDSSWTSIGWRE